MERTKNHQTSPSNHTRTQEQQEPKFNDDDEIKMNIYFSEKCKIANK